MAKEEMDAAVKALRLEMTAGFVPFSKSRNAKEKRPSLNWRVTIKRNGRDVLTTDYGQGCGPCAAYKAPVAALGHANSVMRDDAIRAECETGKVWSDSFPRQAARHTPGIGDVLHSLASDADAIDYAMFEEWASNFGYDTDSRSAEKIYRACLKIALKLRAGLGEDGLRMLRDACQEY